VRELRGVTGPIVNPVAYFGTHARNIARMLPDLEVVASDIDATWNRWYSTLFRITHGTQRNYTFSRESVFSPTHGLRPRAVVFFGACGGLTDAALDYAVGEAVPLIMCRACCHENVGNSTELARYPTLLNYGFRLKNRVLDIYKARNRGWYFCGDYGQEAYPRSASARAVSHAAEFHDIARHALDSDVCRSIIDLDRCMRLQDRGYDVLYEQEIFFALSRAYHLETP